MTTTYNDGSASAPAGSAQLPNLLAGYAAVPPWEVAGVNYAVGIPAGTTLLDPATISMAGVTVNKTSHIITITANNVTLKGYDFGLAGGWGITVGAGVTNTVIEDSHFLVGTNEIVPVRANPGAGNLTLLDNVFDGGSQSSGAVWALAFYEGSGTFTAEYNSFLNSPEDAIDFNVGTMTTVVKYNLFENLGTSTGAHPDAVQYVGVTSNNSVEEFNTIYQPNPSGMQGVQLQAQGGSNLVNTTIDNNVIVAKGPSIEMSYSIAVIQNSNNTINGVNVSNNYIDVTGAYGPFYPPTGSNLVFANNINMKTGAVFANPPHTTTGGDTVVGVTASPKSGTETVGNVITIALTMSEVSTVSGSPTLLLNDGGKAVYAGGSGTNTLSFKYTVAATDTPVSSLAVTGVSLPAGAAVTDSSGNAANFAGADTVFSGLSIVGPSGPVVVPDSASTQENQPVTISVLSVDSDPSATLVPSSVAISTAPAHGTTTINTTTGAITYTPAAGYYGTDSFQYTVADSLGIVSAPDTVTVKVASGPVVAPDSASTQENQPVTIPVLSVDSDPSATLVPSSVAIATAAAHGTTTVNTTTGAITYTPAAGYTGTDTFQYIVADSLGIVSAPDTVTVKVVSGPVVAPDSASTQENQPVTIPVLSVDSDPTATLVPSSVAIATAAAHGTTTVNTTTGAITYTPAAGYYGTDSFQYTVADSLGIVSAPDTVTVNVASGPVMAPASASTQENQAVTIPVLSVDSDPSATLVPSSVAIATAAAHGTMTINTTTGAITYTPAAGYYGTDSFQYTVADSLGIVSAPDTVSVTVAAPTGGGSGYADGSAAAPAGTPQLPSILSGYAASPPWAVAGVNYAVGVPAGMTLKDPTVAGNLPAGATYNATTHTVTVTGNNVDLSGFNFSLDGGIELVIQSNNVTVQDSLFTVGANQGSLGRVVYVTPSAGNVSFLDNEFNGNNVAVTAQSGQMLMVENAGTFTFDYNYVHNTGGDAVDFGGGPQSDVVEYNLFENIGVNTAHADTLQWYDSQITSGLIAFDTVYQNVPQPGPGNGALTLLSEGSTATMTNMVEENDTIVQTGATSSSGATTGNFATGFYADDGGTASNVTIHDLYIDPTGSDKFTGLWLLPNGYYHDNLATPTVVSNVTNMVTGSPSVPSPSSYYIAANGVSPTQSDVVGITASPASGTEMPGNTITFTLTMDEPFTVTGTPALLLNDGGTATYAGGSGSKQLTFIHTVTTSDTTVPTLAVKGISMPSGAAIKDAVGNGANLSGALVSFAGLGVDPPAPTGTTTGTTPASGAGSSTLPAWSLLSSVHPDLKDFVPSSWSSVLPGNSASPTASANHGAGSGMPVFGDLSGIWHASGPFSSTHAGVLP